MTSRIQSKNAIQSAKESFRISEVVLKKDNTCGEDVQLFLLKYRNSPESDFGVSPTQLSKFKNVKL
jgi:hypothetical protein